MVESPFRQFELSNVALNGLDAPDGRLPDLPNDPPGIPGGEHPAGDALRDDVSRADARLRADLHPGTDDRTTADPHIGPDLDGLGELLFPAQFGIHRVCGGVDLDRRAE